MGIESNKYTHKKKTFHGVDFEQLIEMKTEQLIKLFPCRIRRKIHRCQQFEFEKRKHHKLIRKFEAKSKEISEMNGKNEKPKGVKTHSRDMVIMPAMIGCVVAIHNGINFDNVTEIKPEMIGMYLGEFSITTAHSSKHSKHGKKNLRDLSSKDLMKFIPSFH